MGGWGVGGLGGGWGGWGKRSKRGLEPFKSSDQGTMMGP